MRGEVVIKKSNGEEREILHKLRAITSVNI